MRDGPSMLAKSIFDSSGADDGGDNTEMPGKSKMSSAGAVAGKRFARALEGGDGEAIFSAFKALKDEAEGAAEPDGDDTGGDSGGY